MLQFLDGLRHTPSTTKAMGCSSPASLTWVSTALIPLSEASVSNNKWKTHVGTPQHMVCYQHCLQFLEGCLTFFQLLDPNSLLLTHQISDKSSFGGKFKETRAIVARQTQELGDFLLCQRYGETLCYLNLPTCLKQIQYIQLWQSDICVVSESGQPSSVDQALL